VIKTLVVDDEPIARRVLREELELFPDVVVVGEAENGADALQHIAELAPDLVFLDLEMPLMGGFEVIRKLTGNTLPVIVIVTAYNQHAIEAFEAGAVDYLLKPVQQSRLEKAVDRARSLQGRRRERAENAAKLSEAVVPGNVPRVRKIVGRSGDEYFLLDINEILAFQADGEVVWIVTSKTRYLATQPLRAIEMRLKNLPFQRVHRNAIVNVNHVRKLSSMSSQRWLLTLSNSQELMVSKRQAHSVRNMLKW
jgi:two-component system LytT family response regulator